MRRDRFWRFSALCLLVLIGVGHGSPQAQAEPGPEPLSETLELGPVSPHWVLYFMFEPSAEISKYVLFDADTANYKAWITTGYLPSLQQSPDGRELYVADTFLDGPERLRRDVVSFYDTRDYSFSAKIEMPRNRRAMMGPQFRTALVNEGRLLLVFNFPRHGVSVIDTRARTVVAEVETPGCSLLYPTGERGVSMICGDGGLLTLQFDSGGQVREQVKSEPFFDPNVDPVHENAAVIGGTWYFLSYSGDVYPVDLSGDEPVFHEVLALLGSETRQPSENDDSGPWRPGGVQPIAAHASRGEIYVLMHPVAMSGAHDHTFPGTEVWVFDTANGERLRRLPLNDLMNTVFVTADDEPLMVTSGISLLYGGEDAQVPGNREVIPTVSSIQVYDAATGEYLREMKEAGMTYYFETAPGSGGVR